MEVAIVGAGPAGAWAAYRLARAGARVALIDPSHPREKPCGGGITGRALALVSSALDRSLPAVVIRSARVRDASGASAVVPLETAGISPSSTLVVASRRDFDAALVAAATHAGVSIVKHRVADVIRSTGAFHLRLSNGEDLRAGWLIGADGANSLVRRHLLAPFRRDQLSIATGYYARGATSDEIVLEVVGDPPGYLWSFPRPDHIAIGIGAQADAGATAGTLRARTRQWIADVQLAPAATLTPYSWPIPSLGAADLASLTVGGDRWLLAGDAAGLVDPITREGIYFALQSGEFAAAALLGGNRVSARYADRLRDQTVPELVKAAKLKAGFFQPRFSRLLIGALAESAGVRRVFADLVAGRQSYRTLKWRLLETMEFGLAWRVMVG